MRVLLTGSKGYIGSVMVSILNKSGFEVVGLDNCYYKPLRSIEQHPIEEPAQFLKKDIRSIDVRDLAGIDYLVHLAGLSNDPLGQFNRSLTEKINYESTVQLAELAKKSGVKRFIYASSQSMYGISGSNDELNEDLSEKNPITAYADTKWRSEQRIMEMCNEDFTVVAFRPSTVFGSSPFLRTDIVYNNFLACAYTTGKIEIKSDGTPWRPIIHVQDVCNAFLSGIKAPENIVSGRAFNVGIKDGNYTVKDLADAAKVLLPKTEIIYTNEHGNDSRTYKVSFDRILTELKDYYVPQWNLLTGGKELLDFFSRIEFSEEDFRGERTNRLSALKSLMLESKVDAQLIWQ